MIPGLVAIPGTQISYLPPGIYSASMDEIAARFAFNEHRTRLFGGFRLVVQNLQIAGCTEIFVDGSFVSDKALPQDYDGCWNPSGVTVALLDPVLLDFTNQRRAQKEKYFGEMFPAITEQTSGKPFLDFFQTEKRTGTPKGILRIEPQTLEDAS